MHEETSSNSRGSSENCELSGSSDTEGNKRRNRGL